MPHLNSPPSQSSTLKLESENAAKSYQPPAAAVAPLLYDAMPTLSRYEQLGLNVGGYAAGGVGVAGGGGSNSTLSSAGSVANSTSNAHGTGSSSSGGGHYGVQHLHHTLPHGMASGSLPRGRDPLTLADYLTTSSLIDYNLSKAAAAAAPMGTHMTLPKGLAGGAGLSPSQLTTITQKSNTGRNHIITDTLPGPESCV